VGQRDTEFGAVLLVAAVMFIHLVSLLLIISGITGLRILSSLPSKYYALIVGIPLSIVLFKYYSKVKVNHLMDDYGLMPAGKRDFWALLSILAWILPIILIYLLLSGGSKI
jgi:hypothetical protein